MTVDKIKSDIVVCMKSKDSEKLTALRLIKNSLDKEQKESGSLTEEKTQKILETLLKQRKESEVAFRAGGRLDLADAEAREAAIISDYLPKEITREQLEEIVNYIPVSKMGPMIQEAKKIISDLGFRVDGKLLSELVKSKV